MYKFKVNLLKTDLWKACKSTELTLERAVAQKISDIRLSAYRLSMNNIDFCYFIVLLPFIVLDAILFP